MKKKTCGSVNLVLVKSLPTGFWTSGRGSRSFLLNHLKEEFYICNDKMKSNPAQPFILLKIIVWNTHTPSSLSWIYQVQMKCKKYLCWSSLTDSCDHVTKKNVRLWGRLKSGYQNGVIGKKKWVGNQWFRGRETSRTTQVYRVACG